MSLATSLPWVGSRTENLPLSDPRCSSDACKAFYDAHKLSQKRISYEHQYDYGHYTVWYYIAFLGVFTVLCWCRKLQEHRFRTGHGSGQSVAFSSRSKVVAAWRFMAYRRLPGWMSDRFGLPSLGMLIMFLLPVVYLAALTFAVRPYYRQHRGYGSPPLGVRTGLMAVALTPLLIALSGKANIITLLTGIGHEKLNIIHRWVGWMTFVLSVAHTVPFIVAPLRDGGYAALHKQFYKHGAFEASLLFCLASWTDPLTEQKYTGVPPLAILFGVLVLSLPWIRHRVYEVFYHLHVWLAVTYVGLMFWHAGAEGDSWAYLWATIAAWLASILARAFWFTRPTNVMASPWAVGMPITARPLPGGVTRLEILAPPAFTWRPGQHIYLRIPQLGLFDNHPFTIGCAMPTQTTADEKPDAPPTLSLYVNTHAGFTRRLHGHLASSPDPQLDGWIEGPYGGHDRDVAVHYDNVLLVAGGSGISATLPWLEHFAARMRAGPRSRTAHVKLVWSVRESAAVRWVADDLARLDLASLASKVDVVVHVTRDGIPGGVADASSAECSYREKDPATPLPGNTATFRRGRMDMTALSAGLSGRTIVIGKPSRTRLLLPLPCVATDRRQGCGPRSFKVDLSNACAAHQGRVMAGTLAELYLWTETFGW